MKYAICPLSVVPVQSSITDKNEQLTQLLFGDLVEILEIKGKQWLKVRCDWDHSIGWVRYNQLQPITPSEFEAFRTDFALNFDLLCTVLNEQFSIPVPFGARLPMFDGLRFQLGGQSFTCSGQAVFPKSIQRTPELLVKLAQKLLFAPYQKGGLSPLGIDGPGFTQLAFRMMDYKLGREAAEQVLHGDAIDFVEHAQIGDLAFFENRKGKIDHVGILVDKNHIIHVDGRVRIDKIDHYGIYDESTKKYLHPLRVLRRIPIFEAPLPNQAPAKEETQINQFQLFG
ncbi:MAG: C40 family peptidase [Phaeodactylibacter sp.]|nr:C40 family peptidase [Phaeodactylibacter sp.]